MQINVKRIHNYMLIAHIIIAFKCGVLRILPIRDSSSKVLMLVCTLILWLLLKVVLFTFSNRGKLNAISVPMCNDGTRVGSINVLR